MKIKFENSLSSSSERETSSFETYNPYTLIRPTSYRFNSSALSGKSSINLSWNEDKFFLISPNASFLVLICSLILADLMVSSHKSQIFSKINRASISTFRSPITISWSLVGTYVKPIPVKIFLIFRLNTVLVRLSICSWVRGFLFVDFLFIICLPYSSKFIG